MLSFSIPLQHVLIDLDREIDLSSLPIDESLFLLREAYAFLPAPVEVSIAGDVAHIQSLKKPSKSAGDAPDLFQRATKFAGQGSLSRAIELYERVLERDPGHLGARRNLGMALLESGQVEAARQRLVESTRLAPNDGWTYLLLANSFATEGDREKSLRFYETACRLNPSDPFSLTSYAGVLAETGETTRARELMETALTHKPLYPNAVYGLALLDFREGQPVKADERLVTFFNAPRDDDPRSKGVYQAARSLALDITRDLAQRNQTEAEQAVESRRLALEEEGGIPIDLVVDETIASNAITKMAWNYGEARHRVLYKNHDVPVALHYVAHELEHIQLEGNNRADGRHRAFTSTPRNQEKSLDSIEREVQKLRQSGLSEMMLTQMLMQMVNGMTGQVFNNPLDMLIEWGLGKGLGSLRPAQLLSLVATHREVAQIAVDPQIRKLTPPTIYENNCALNYSFALFTDWLSENRTDFAAELRESLSDHVVKKGQKVFDLWRKMMGLERLRAGDTFAMESKYSPGDEYPFIDEVASLLGLSDWYEWRFQGEEGDDKPAPMPTAAQPHVEENPSGTTNPELLRSKEPATMMFLLGALRRYGAMGDDEVREIAFEIAMVGRDGIDYSDPDRRFHLASLPEEEFSGLQLLALMYVGFRRVTPQHDTGLDFAELYAAALQLFEAQE